MLMDAAQLFVLSQAKGSDTAGARMKNELYSQENSQLTVFVAKCGLL
jgi:hypothetical protein